MALVKLSSGSTHPCPSQEGISHKVLQCNKFPSQEGISHKALQCNKFPSWEGQGWVLLPRSSKRHSLLALLAHVSHVASR